MRAIAARQRLGQQFHHLAVDPRLLEIDERNLQVLRQQIVQRRLGHEAEVGEHAAELAARALLLGQRRGELFAR